MGLCFQLKAQISGVPLPQKVSRTFSPKIKYKQILSGCFWENLCDETNMATVSIRVNTQLSLNPEWQMQSIRVEDVK